METIKGKMAAGAAWLAATRVIVNLLALASTILLARFLTPSDFGLVAIATSLLAVVMSLTELSLASALVQHKDPTDDHFHSAWTIAMIRSSLIAIVVCAAAIPIASLYNDERLRLVVVVVGLTGALGGLASPKAVILTKQLIFWPDFLVNVSQKVITLLFAIPIAYIYRSYWSIVLAASIGTIASVTISYLVVPYLPRFRLTHFKELFGFSMWLSLGQAVNTLNWRFDQFLLGYFVGKPQLGIYSVADNLASLPTREATAPLAQTLFPGFVKLRGDPARLKRGYLLAQSTVCAVALPFGFGFATVAHPMILLTIGEKWLEAVPIIQILSGTFALQTLATSLQPLAMATGNTRTLFGRDLRNLIIRIPFIVVGLWLGGLMGVVIARFFSSFIGTILNMILVRKLAGLSLRQQFAANSRALVSVVVMLAAASGMQVLLGKGVGQWFLFVDLTATIVVAAFAYVASMTILWRLQGRPAGPESELARLLQRFKRGPVTADGAAKP